MYSPFSKEDIQRLKGALGGPPQRQEMGCYPQNHNMEAFTSLECFVNTHKLPIVVVDVKGFIADLYSFQEKVVAPANEAVERAIKNSRKLKKIKLRLVLDLRNVCMVGKSTVLRVMEQYISWVLDRFERVCVIMPRPHGTRHELVRAYNEYKDTIGVRDAVSIEQITRVVERARDVREFIEPRRIPGPGPPFPYTSPI